jgi:hypothetical protein
LKSKATAKVFNLEKPESTTPQATTYSTSPRRTTTFSPFNSNSYSDAKREQVDQTGSISISHIYTYIYPGVSALPRMENKPLLRKVRRDEKQAHGPLAEVQKGRQLCETVVKGSPNRIKL